MLGTYMEVYVQSKQNVLFFFFYVLHVFSGQRICSYPAYRYCFVVCFGQELDQQRKDIFRLAGDLEKQIAAKKELEKMCANLNEEKTLHQTTVRIVILSVFPPVILSVQVSFCLSKCCFVYPSVILSVILSVWLIICVSQHQSVQSISNPCFLFLLIGHHLPVSQATIFQQDFEQERRDREQAHTKHLEVEERYQHQLNALGQESQKVMDELQRVKAETRKMENDYQVRLSQQSYVAGEVDKKKGELQQRNQELEVRQVWFL